MRKYRVYTEVSATTSTLVVGNLWTGKVLHTIHFDLT